MMCNMNNIDIVKVRYRITKINKNIFIHETFN